jgi:hypothetical protein
VGVSLPLPEDGLRSSRRKLSSSYLEFRVIEKVRTPSVSQSYFVVKQLHIV